MLWTMRTHVSARLMLGAIVIGMGITWLAFIWHATRTAVPWHYIESFGPRAMGDSQSIEYDDKHRYFTVQASAIIRKGVFLRQGKWCLTTPTCWNCQDSAICPPCDDYWALTGSKLYPKSRTLCQDRRQESFGTTPVIYSLILALSTAYLVSQIKILVVLWLPRLQDVLLKSQQLYEYDLQLVREGRPHYDEFTSCEALQKQVLCRYGHSHELEGINIPSFMCMYIWSFLSPKELINCERVCSKWKAVSRCNSSWYALYKNQFKCLAIPLAKQQGIDFRSAFIHQMVYSRAKTNVEKFIHHRELREEEQADQIDDMRTMEYFRKYSSYASIATIFWQYSTFVVETMQWTACIVAIAMAFYYASLGFARLLAQHQKTMTALVFCGLICGCIYVINMAMQYSRVPELDWSTTEILQAFFTALRFTCLLHMVLQLIAVTNARPLFRRQPIMWLLCSVMAILIVELCCVHFEIQTPIISSTLHLCLPAVLFLSRWIAWGYCIGCLSFFYYEDISRTSWYRNVSSAVASLVVIEVVFTYALDHPNVLLLWLLDGGQFMILQSLRMIAMTIAIVRLVLMGCWIFVERKQSRSILMTSEMHQLKTSGFQFAAMEAIAYVLNLPTRPMMETIPLTLSALATYIHWSRSITLLAMLSVIQQPPFSLVPNTSKRRYWCQLSLFTMSLIIVAYDTYYDMLDEPGHAQPMLTSVWLGLFMLT